MKLTLFTALLALMALTAQAKAETIVWEQPSAYIPAKANRFKIKKVAYSSFCRINLSSS